MKHWKFGGCVLQHSGYTSKCTLHDTNGEIHAKEGHKEWREASVSI